MQRNILIEDGLLAWRWALLSTRTQIVRQWQALVFLAMKEWRNVISRCDHVCWSFQVKSGLSWLLACLVDLPTAFQGTFKAKRVTKLLISLTNVFPEIRGLVRQVNGYWVALGRLKRHWLNLFLYRSLSCNKLIPLLFEGAKFARELSGAFARLLLINLV